MCKSTALRIVNGLIGEDMGIINLTCITANGTSLLCVDCLIILSL